MKAQECIAAAEERLTAGHREEALALVREGVLKSVRGKPTALLGAKAANKLLPGWGPALSLWRRLAESLGRADDETLLLNLALLGPLVSALTDDELLALRRCLRETPWVLTHEAAVNIARRLDDRPEILLAAGRELASGPSGAGFNLCLAALERREKSQPSDLSEAPTNRELAILAARAAAQAQVTDPRAATLVRRVLPVAARERRFLEPYLEADRFDFQIRDLLDEADDLAADVEAFKDRVQRRIDSGAYVAARRLCEALLVRQLAPGPRGAAPRLLEIALKRFRGEDAEAHMPIVVAAARHLGLLMALGGDASEQARDHIAHLLARPQHRDALGTVGASALENSLGHHDLERVRAQEARLRRGAAGELTDDEQEALAALDEWVHRNSPPPGQSNAEGLHGVVPPQIIDAMGRSVEAALRAIGWSAERLADRQTVQAALHEARVDATFDELRYEHLAILDAVAERFVGSDRALAAAASGLWGVAGLPGAVANLPSLMLVCFRSSARIALCYGIDVSQPEFRNLPVRALLHAVGAPDLAVAWERSEAAAAIEGERRPEASVVLDGVTYAAVALSTEGLAQTGRNAAMRAVMERIAARLLTPAATKRLAARAVPVLGALAGAQVGYRLLSDVNRATFNLVRWHFLRRKLGAAEIEAPTP